MDVELSPHDITSPWAKCKTVAARVSCEKKQKIEVKNPFSMKRHVSDQRSFFTLIWKRFHITMIYDHHEEGSMIWNAVFHVSYLKSFQPLFSVFFPLEHYQWWDPLSQELFSGHVLVNFFNPMWSYKPLLDMRTRSKNELLTKIFSSRV